MCEYCRSCYFARLPTWNVFSQVSERVIVWLSVSECLCLVQNKVTLVQ